jgi:ATP-binding cassette, subfamily B, multidrug efflux pump
MCATRRLVVLDRGRIVEQGSHDALFRQEGHYAELWRRQSGGFVDVAAEQAAPGNARLLLSCKLNKGRRKVACI